MLRIIELHSPPKTLIFYKLLWLSSWKQIRPSYSLCAVRLIIRRCLVKLISGMLVFWNASSIIPKCLQTSVQVCFLKFLGIYSFLAKCAKCTNRGNPRRGLVVTESLMRSCKDPDSISGVSVMWDSQIANQVYRISQSSTSTSCEIVPISLFKR